MKFISLSIMSACLAWSADVCANLPMVSPQPWNQMALNPPMGWNSWYGLCQKVSDSAVREQVELLISLGLKDLGYTYINLDDGWQGGRDQSGHILASSAKFPQGIAPLADYVHSRGLKFGIYTSPASTTCADPTGSLGHEALDAATFATWGIDLLKYDFCAAANDYKAAGCWNPPAVGQLMAESLRSTKRPIVYSISYFGLEAAWAKDAGANMWRIGQDSEDRWNNVTHYSFGRLGDPGRVRGRIQT